MAVKIRYTDPSVDAGERVTSWDSGASDFAQDDVLDIGVSLQGSASRVRIEVAAASTCTFKINTLQRRYPLLTNAKNLCIPAPDLQNEAIWYKSNAEEVNLIAGQEWESSEIITSLQFDELTGTVVVTAMS